MKLIEGIANFIIFSTLEVILMGIALKHGYIDGFPSVDAQYIVGGLIIAGTLASSK